MKRPTIKDVAARAGVSKSTVSLVVQKSALVAEDTKAVVEQAMRELNYVRNRAAATLRGSSTGLVGLIINDLKNPFFTEFAASVQMALLDRGFATVIAILMGMVNPIPSLPPELLAMAVLMPMNSPLRFSSGPPLLPGLMAASVCMKSW